VIVVTLRFGSAATKLLPTDRDASVMGPLQLCYSAAQTMLQLQQAAPI